MTPGKGQPARATGNQVTKDRPANEARDRDIVRNAAHKFLAPIMKKQFEKEGIPFNPLDPTVSGGKNDLLIKKDAVQRNTDTKLIFIGTGTSGATPHAWCFLQEEGSQFKCTTCACSWAWMSKENFKNRRANTSVIVVKQSQKDQKMKTFVIDVGMHWKMNALLLFKAHRLRKIDALLLSHYHSDDWTEIVYDDKFYGSIKLEDLDTSEQEKFRIQDHVDIYATKTTKAKLKKNKPYVVDQSAGSGSGNVASYNWVSLENNRDCDGDLEFEVEGIKVKGVDVHHGLENPHAPNPEPLLCTSFRIEDDIVYIGDVSNIPEGKLEKLKRPRILVIDCLETREVVRQSHFHLEDSLKWAKEIDAERTYLTGFSHNTSYEAYTEIIEGAKITHFDSEEHRRELEQVQQRINEKCLLLRKNRNGEGLDVRVAYDGLCVNITTMSVDGKKMLFVRDDMDREKATGGAKTKAKMTSSTQKAQGDAQQPAQL